MAKAIALCVVLVVTATLLFNDFTTKPSAKEAELNFSRFLEEVTNKNVKRATIKETHVTGEFNSGGAFRTVIPPDYPALFDKMAGVDIKIERPTPNMWLAVL